MERKRKDWDSLLSVSLCQPSIFTTLSDISAAAPLSFRSFSGTEFPPFQESWICFGPGRKFALCELAL
ncbi:hypothetical protein ABKV19_018747 [Rosa sericea]